MVPDDGLALRMAVAQDAYQRARIQVFDQFPPGEPIDYDALTPPQVIVLDDLARVEAELAEFRQKSYALV